MYPFNHYFLYLTIIITHELVLSSFSICANNSLRGEWDDFSSPLSFCVSESEQVQIESNIGSVWRFGFLKSPLILICFARVSWEISWILAFLTTYAKCLAPSISAAWLRDSEGIARSRTRTYQQGNWCCSSRRSRSKSFSIHEFINVNFFSATCSRYIFEPGSNMPLGLASLRHKIYVRTS